MSEDMKDGEAMEPIVEKQLSFEDINKAIADAVVENNKKWQSRFDQILTEKKQTETKAMTVEEQIQQLKIDREQERVQWARKEAKAKSGIDDDLQNAILAYASNDPDRIADAALLIKGAFDARSAQYEKELEEMRKKLQFGTKAPTGGATATKTFDTMSMTELMNYAKTSPEAQAEVLNYQKNKRPA